MRVAVDFQNERLDFELPDDRIVAAWTGPAGLDASSTREALRNSLEQPLDYPALRQIAVPGDRIVIAFDPAIAHAQAVLEVITQTFGEAGVGPSDLTVVVPAGNPALGHALPAGVSLVIHDPNDRGQIAYLATTKQGRRVYLNRNLTDADVVVPVARLGYDPILGHRGPWSLLFPELSDHETQTALRGQSTRRAADPSRSKSAPKLDESLEVSWLLGSQFHIGLVPGKSGIIEAVAGRETTVRDQGLAALDRHWQFQAASRADLVVVGIGQSEIPTTLESLAAGLATATRLVQQGGRIVVLSRAVGEIGPALEALRGMDSPKDAPALLRGRESAEDFGTARQLAQALDWADIFLLSSLPEQIVEDLCVVALETPAQARRLVAQSNSCLFVSGAELTSAVVAD